MGSTDNVDFGPVQVLQSQLNAFNRTHTTTCEQHRDLGNFRHNAGGAPEKDSRSEWS